MKKMYFVLLLILPIVVNAQKVSNTPKEAEKKSIKYEDMVSKSGVVCTTYTYPIDDVELSWSTSTQTFTEKLSFSIERVIVGNIDVSYLSIRYPKRPSFAMIEESNVKELCSTLIKMKEIRKNPVPDGASAEYSYYNSDGIVINCSKVAWKIQLDKFSKDYFYVSDIDPFISKLEEIIQKMASIK